MNADETQIKTAWIEASGPAEYGGRAAGVLRLKSITEEFEKCLISPQCYPDFMGKMPMPRL